MKPSNANQLETVIKTGEVVSDNRYKYLIEKTWVEQNKPSSAHYKQESRLTQKTVTGPSIKKRIMEEMSPSPDGRGPLHPNLDAVRKTVTNVKIAPVHEVLLSELLKEFDERKNGPAAYSPKFKLVEARTDIGGRNFERENAKE
jgi:hypothetical protein